MATAKEPTEPKELSSAEIELRRYEAKLDLLKIVLGSSIVGLAGVLIPGAVSFYNSHFENLRKGTELVQSQQSAHQQYIKDFFETAVNQDIELRIRFANYFENLSGSGQEGLWRNYLNDLENQRTVNRISINTLETRLVELQKTPEAKRDVAEYDRVNRELSWAYGEIGYVPIKRSTVLASEVATQENIKDRLYRETTELVRKIAASSLPLDENSDEVARFWELYKKELIGVESREFAQIMIEIGKRITTLSSAGSPPNEELKHLTGRLGDLAAWELSSLSNNWAPNNLLTPGFVMPGSATGR